LTAAAPVPLLDRAARALAYLGGLVLAALAVLMTADVALRALGAPIFGALDLVQLALVVVVFAGVAHCGRGDGHVAVDLFAARLGPRAAFASQVAIKLATLAILALLAWRMGVRAWSAGPGDASNLLEVPRWPFYAFATLGAALYAAMLGLEAMALLARGPKRGAD
jgi:TRAP-type C4-dicarboxylate transport system permease small subunit